MAAAMVVVHHVRFPGLTWFSDGLGAGVLIFFALSGYLLYRPFVEAQLRGEANDLRAYGIRRVARIYPAFLFATLGVVALTGWTSYFRDPIGLLTITNTPIAVAWTLLIELVFYGLLPVFVYVTRRMALVERVRVILAISIVSLALGAASMATTHTIPNDPIRFLWAFAPGMVVAELAARRHPALERLQQRRWLGVGAILITASTVLQIPYADPLATAGSAILVASLLGTRNPVGWKAKTAAAGGALSYAVYLWHLPIIDAVDRPATWVGGFAAIAITIGIAGVSYVVVERPIMKLGHRLARARRRGVHLLSRDPEVT